MAQPKTDSITPEGTITRSAVDATLDAARIARPIHYLDDGRTIAITPDAHTYRDITDPHRLPPFIKTAVTVDDRASLVIYINRFQTPQSLLIADYDAGKIAARLDWHNPSVDDVTGIPAPLTHTATLALRDSEEFKRWAAIQGKMLPQAEFAAFLEENATDITDPEPTTMIEISRDLEATQGVAFKSSTRLENGDRAFVYETETRAKGDVKVPREFTLDIPLYNGEAPRPLRCAFRWRIAEGGLFLGFEWRRVEYIRRAEFSEIATTVSEDTGRPVIFGRQS